MLICPVCRSQNMEAAKFCGNCGHPFPRQAEPVSALVNCTHGHIYSAVYNHCPYCPQPTIAPVAPTVKETDTAFDFPLSGEMNGDHGHSIELGVDEMVTNSGDEEEVMAETVSQPGAVIERLVDRRADSFSQGTEGRGFGQDGTHRTNGRRPISSRLAGVANGNGETNRPTPPDPDPVRAQMAAGYQYPTPLNGVSPVVGGLLVGGGAEIGRRTVIATSEVGTGAASRGKIVGWLVSYTANPDGEDFRIHAGHNRIGANPICDIIINDDTVSGSHAILVYREGRCLIKDDLSRNGTFVNGREITEAHPLQNYDQIRLGNTYLVFVSAQRV